jgi:hypothetical protein
MKVQHCSTQISIKDFKRSDDLKNSIRQKLEKYLELGCQLDHLRCDGSLIAMEWKSN